MLKPLTVLVALVFAVAAFAADDARFSQSVAAPDRVACGLGGLNSDQLGALDALVRRDAMARTSVNANPPKLFSQRLTADERRVTGLSSLNTDELGKLDAAIERFEAPRMAQLLLGPPTYARTPARVRTEDARRGGEVHGEFSLSYGWGKGGYSEKTGAMVLHYDDPEHRFGVTVGYSESHVKGPMIYRDPLDPYVPPGEPR